MRDPIYHEGPTYASAGDRGLSRFRGVTAKLQINTLDL
jgi:hypothetical protein